MNLDDPTTFDDGEVQGMNKGDLLITRNHDTKTESVYVVAGTIKHASFGGLTIQDCVFLREVKLPTRGVNR